jgi:hypothetical protein
VYADNIAMNEKLAHPAHFDMGDCLDLVDVHGMTTTLRFWRLLGSFRSWSTLLLNHTESENGYRKRNPA